MKITVLASLLALAPAFASADDIYGMWKSEPGESGGYIKVDIHACGAMICGTIKEVVGNDNKDPEGKAIIKNMKAGSNGRYSGGTIWAPDTDKTYRSKMSLSGNKLTVKGCVGPICRGQTWTRL